MLQLRTLLHEQFYYANHSVDLSIVKTKLLKIISYHKAEINQTCFYDRNKYIGIQYHPIIDFDFEKK